MPKEHTSFAIDPPINIALRELAKREQRSRNWLVNQILREGVAERLERTSSPAPQQPVEAPSA